MVAVESADGTSVQFNIHLSGDENTTAPFNLGLAAPGLGLNGSVALDLHWELTLDVGLSSTDGFDAVADGTTNVVLNAGITAGAGIDLGLISGGVRGGIYATISMTLNDPDQSGKLRLETFIAELSHPLSIFIVSGRVYAQLSAYLTVGISFLSHTFTFDITPEITLLTFNDTPAATPVLATMGSGGSLKLNTGANSANRGTGNTNQGDHTFTVAHSSGAAGNEAVAVTAYGYTTTYSNVNNIVASGGLSNDTIDMTGVQSDTTITGGQGNNTIIGGSGRNTLVENQFTNYTLTSGGLLMDRSNSDTFKNIQNVVLQGPSGGEATFTLSGYVGDSTLAVHGGNNTFDIDLSADGLTRITDDGSAGNPDHVVVTLADGEDTTIGATQVVQGVNTIDYSGDAAPTTLTVNGTQANTRYTIQDTPVGPIATTLNTGDGNDAVFVEKTSGPTTVNAGAGTTTVDVGSLNLEDSGDSAAQTLLVTNSAPTQLGMAAAPQGITYAGLAALNVFLGTGGDTASVQSTNAATATTIAGAAHSKANTFDIGSLAPTLSRGVVAGIAGSGADTMNVDNTGDTNFRTSTLANNTNAAELITTTTGFNQPANGTTFRVPFADKHNVALFFVAPANTHAFDLQDVVFTDEHQLGGITSDPRNGVTALVTTSLALAGAAAGTTRRAQLTSVALNGDGGSFATGQSVTGSITSTGALGDVTLSAAQRLTANLTAPSIFGSIRALGGPIAGTIQATGVRIDPITGARSTVEADIGQLTAGPTGTMTDSQILAEGSLISQVVSHGPISGLIAARGNIGATATGPGGTTVRSGGISSQGLLSGQVIAAGNILGDLAFQGGLAGGQIAAQVSILGNVVVAGSFDAKSSIIVGGTIGSATLGTGLTLAAGSTGTAGLVAAKGAVRFTATSSRPTNLYQSLPAGPNASPIDAQFAQVDTDLASGTPAAVALEPAKLKSVAGRLTFGP